ncbi:hypothetical protein [Streptomyces sp. NPDC048350]|uniref:hypothetical protein n=1 Tax=Streptomyces sp. NPDC048350 TaxID=3365538 RepID=UPI003723718E
MSELYTAESGTGASDAQGVPARDAPLAAGFDDQPMEPLEPESGDFLDGPEDDVDIPEEPDAPDWDSVDQEASADPENEPEESDPVEPGDVTSGSRPDDVNGADSPEPVEPTDQLSEMASHLEDRKLTTDSGEAFYGHEDTEMREMAAKLEPEEGAFTLDLHGTPTSVEVDGLSINAEELGAYLASDKSDWDGEPIRLMSCETGQGEEPFAQELADNLGVPATAPTELAWSDSQGNSWVASGVFDEYGDMHSTWPPDGEWVTFEPNDKNDKS